MNTIAELLSSELARRAIPGPELLTSMADLPETMLERQHQLERELLAMLRGRRSGGLALPGYCAVCDAETRFAFRWDGQAEINWRDSLTCRRCSLINRWRAAIDVSLGTVAGASQPGLVYVTEQLSPLYRCLARRLPRLVGSEFRNEGTEPGARCFYRLRPFRHEDVTRLSFDNNQLDHLWSFDVLEHVPAYEQALREFWRTLKPGGSLVVSVPFAIKSESTLVRAIRSADGDIQHLVAPEYHGDPTGSGGILCYYHFGWDLLDRLREAGFETPGLRLLWDPGKGYLGLGQCLILASKPRCNGPCRR